MASSQQQTTATRNIGIFWDLHTARPSFDCSIDEFLATIANIRSVARKYAGTGPIKYFRAYANISKYISNKSERLALQQSGIDLVDTPMADDKAQQDKYMLTDLCLFAREFDSAATIIITGNEEFSFAVNKFCDRGFSVVLVGPVQQLPSFFTAASAAPALRAVDWSEIGLSKSFEHKDIKLKLSGKSKQEKRAASDVIILDRICKLLLDAFEENFGGSNAAAASTPSDEIDLSILVEELIESKDLVEYCRMYAFMFMLRHQQIVKLRKSSATAAGAAASSKKQKSSSSEEGELILQISSQLDITQALERISSPLQRDVVRAVHALVTSDESSSSKPPVSFKNGQYSMKLRDLNDRIHGKIIKMILLSLYEDKEQQQELPSKYFKKLLATYALSRNRDRTGYCIKRIKR